MNQPLLHEDPSRIDAALAAARDLAATAKNLTALGLDFGPDLARWAVQQWALRARARERFPGGDSMWWEAEALEQATHPAVAEYHAAHFPAGERVVDLTAGVGADLIAFAARGPAVGYELDPVRARCAALNLGGRAEVRVEDSLSAPWEAPYAYADPSRRSGGARTYDPAAFAPDPELVVARMAGVRLGLIKLSPMLFDEYLESLGRGVALVSFGGQCREALVRLGPEARFGFEAVHLESGEVLGRTLVPQVVESPADFLFDADPALVRAHGLGHFGLPALGTSPGYLTGPEPIHSPWLRGYRVRWHGRFDASTLRRELERRGLGTPEIKQRGPKLNLTRLRNQLQLKGAVPGWVVLWSVERAIRAAIVEPIPSALP